MLRNLGSKCVRSSRLIDWADGAGVIGTHITTRAGMVFAQVRGEVAALPHRICPTCLRSPLRPLIVALLALLFGDPLVTLWPKVIIDPSQIGDFEEVEAV